MSSLGTVALFNSNLEAMGLLRRLLGSAGFAVASAPIPDLRDGLLDVDALIAQNNPTVIIYDITAPYPENWRRFERLKATTPLSNRRFVITAADAGQVERLAANDEHIFEVIDEESDFGAIIQAVKEAARARTTRIDDPATIARSNVLRMQERRTERDRRHSSWSSNDIYQKLREKREQVETERRRGGRRATDVDHDPHHHAA